MTEGRELAQQEHWAAYAAQKRSAARRLVQALPPSVQRIWSSYRARRSIERYEPKIVNHLYMGVPLRVMIADQLGDWWYNVDWPETEMPELAVLAERSLRPGSTVFDIGAHQGIVALVMAHLVGGSGRVVAVEPNAHQAGIAVQNLLLNRCRQLTLLRAAVGDEMAQLPFDEFGATVGSGIGARRVASITVDDLMATYGRPDVVYVDVEGFECQVLKGAAAVLAERPDVCVEIHGGGLIEAQGGSVAEVLSYFRTDDYELLVNTSPNDNKTGFVPLDESTITGRTTLLALSRTQAAASLRVATHAHTEDREGEPSGGRD